MQCSNLHHLPTPSDNALVGGWPVHKVQTPHLTHINTCNNHNNNTHEQTTPTPTMVSSNNNTRPTVCAACKGSWESVHSLPAHNIIIKPQNKIYINNYHHCLELLVLFFWVTELIPVSVWKYNMKYFVANKYVLYAHSYLNSLLVTVYCSHTQETFNSLCSPAENKVKLVKNLISAVSTKKGSFQGT